MKINKEHLKREKSNLLKDLTIAKEYIEDNLGMSVKEEICPIKKTTKVSLYVTNKKLFEKQSRESIDKATNWVSRIFTHLQKISAMQNPELLKKLKTHKTKH